MPKLANIKKMNKNKNIRMLNKSKEKKKYIYESPDNGKTVYRSEGMGCPTSRELMYAKRELGTITDDDIIKDFFEEPGSAHSWLQKNKDKFPNGSVVSEVMEAYANYYFNHKFNQLIKQS